MQMGVFRPDRGVIEPRRNRMSQSDLSEFVLQQIAFCTLQDADIAARHESRRVLSQCFAAATGLDADHSYIVIKKRMKQPYRVRSAADAGNENVRQAVFFFNDLLAGL